MQPQQPQALGTNTPSVDPTALNLARAIRKVESGDNPNAKGASGEFGIGQWMPGNFESAAKQYGLDPNDRSQGNQEHVLYNQIEDQVKAGHSQSQIASWWNSGKYDPTGNVGVNKEGVKYDTPAYVERVKQAYLQQAGQAQGSQQSPTSNYPTQQLQIPAGVSTVNTPNATTGDNSFIGDVSKTLGQAGTGVGNAVTQTLSGQINPVSGVIQGVGSLAGGVNGLIGNTLEHLPVVGGIVKGAEGLIGQGIGAAAQTAPGQAVAQGVQSFTQAHPELSGDIGGLVNIGTLVGGGLGGAAAKDVAEEGLYNAAKKGVLGSSAQGLVKSSIEKKAAQILETAPTVKSVGAAIRGGRLATAKGGVSMVADPLKAASIKEITPLVESGVLVPGKATANAIAIKSVADDTAVYMRNLLREQDVQNVLQPEELQGMAQRVLSRAGEGLPTGENPAQALLNKFYEALPKDRDITAEDVLNARQAVSRFVLENKGDWNQRGVMTGFKTARDSIWDESRNLLVQMAPNVPVRDLLEKQSNLYRALDYLPAAVKKELTTEQKGRIAAYFARHPLQGYAAKQLGKGALIGAGVPYGAHFIEGL